MEITLTCKRKHVEGIVTSLECEGYSIYKQPVPLYLNAKKEDDTALYAVFGRCIYNTGTAIEEWYALNRTGWWYYSNSHVETCYIQGENHDVIQWNALALPATDNNTNVIQLLKAGENKCHR